MCPSYSYLSVTSSPYVNYIAQVWQSTKGDSFDLYAILVAHVTACKHDYIYLNALWQFTWCRQTMWSFSLYATENTRYQVLYCALGIVEHIVLRSITVITYVTSADYICSHDADMALCKYNGIQRDLGQLTHHAKLMGHVNLTWDIWVALASSEYSYTIVNTMLTGNHQIFLH